MVEGDSVTGVERKIWVGSLEKDCDKVERARLLGVLGLESKLRWEACEKISSSIALSAWDRMDIESTVVESLWFGFTTDGEVTVGMVVWEKR